MISAIANPSVARMPTKRYLRNRLECPSVNQLRRATGCGELTSNSVVRHKLHFEFREKLAKTSAELASRALSAGSKTKHVDKHWLLGWRRLVPSFVCLLIWYHPVHCGLCFCFFPFFQYAFALAFGK
jgi:hypothetical protein